MPPFSAISTVETQFEDNHERVPMRLRSLRALQLTMLLATAVWFPSCARAAEPAKTHTVTAGEVKLAVPESWPQKETTSRFRLAQFAVPKTGGDAEDAEFVVYYFGAGGGGNVDPNIHRWINQFQSQDRKVKLTSGKCPQGDYVLVDLHGTWKKPIGPPIQQKTVEMPNARVLSVILTVKDQGNYFLRLMGPEKTVSANADALRVAIGTDAKSEKDYKVSEEN
jgi:gluconolactonase